MSNPDHPKKPSKWIRRAVIATSVYAVLVAIPIAWHAVSEWPALLSMSCPAVPDDGPLNIFGYCLTLNELGDFLAGVFAPLAFVWLTAAVLIQSEELSAQKEELALTRQELEEQRKVMIAQTDEARRQAEFIGQQTRILEQERDERDVANADELLRSRLDALSNWLEREFKLVAPQIIRTGPKGLPVPPMPATPDWELYRSRFGQAHSADLFSVVMSATIDVITGTDTDLLVHSENYVAFKGLADRCKEILLLSDRVSESWRLNMRDADFDALADDLTLIAYKCSLRSGESAFAEFWEQRRLGVRPNQMPGQLDPSLFEIVKRRSMKLRNPFS